ncbi:MAG TPA: bifunctional nuclease family protein [Chthonomonadales bacterium]|nr:bifunctional nuclease family protein [Chthonomonadales bacterium]
MGHDFKDLFPDWEPEEHREGAEGANPGELEPENRQPRQLFEKEVKVVGVFEHPDPTSGGIGQAFVLLQDRKGRKVPIYIGPFEARAIMMAVDGESSDRPMTHDLVKLLLDRLGTQVERVIIDDLFGETFYAKMLLKGAAGNHEVDCRPSDAVAIALRMRAPIYMAESVLESVDRKS